jgi:hypothetical protein
LSFQQRTDNHIIEHNYFQQPRAVNRILDFFLEHSTPTALDSSPQPRLEHSNKEKLGDKSQHGSKAQGAQCPFQIEEVPPDPEIFLNQESKYSI